MVMMLRREHVSALSIVVVALAAGLALWSASGVAWAVVGIAACATAFRLHPGASQPHHRWMLSAAAVLASMLAVRRAPTLVAINAFGTLLLLLGASAVWRFGSPSAWGPVRFVGQLLWACLHLVDGLADAAGAARARVSGGDGRIVPIVRGAAVTVVPLVVFTALFASADAVFERGIGWLLETLVSPVEFLPRLVFALVASGLVYGLAAPSSLEPVQQLAPPQRRLDVELGVAVWTLVALFTTFVAVQFSTLFGGRAFVLEVSGLTMADYARSGFFELVTVTSLVLAIAYPILWLAETPRLRAGVVTLLGLTAVVAVSALMRMFVYVHAFGLTELRFYTSVFMLWLMITLAVVAVQGWRGRVSTSTSLALAAGVVIVMAVNVANPDAVISRVNIERAAVGAEVDVAHLATLSSDALPTIAARIGVIDACAAAAMIDLIEPPAPDLSEWTLSDVRARAAWPPEFGPGC